MVRFDRFTAIAFSAATLFGVAACSDSTGAGTGTVSVRLTNASVGAPMSADVVTSDAGSPLPAGFVKSVDIFVVRVDGRVEDVDEATADQNVTSEAESERDGWKTLATPNASINLLELQNGVVSTVGEAKIAAASYRGFRLVIDPSKSSVTLKNSQVLTSTSSPSVTFPSASRSGIKIGLSGPVVVGEDGKTTMVVDFDVASSFVMRGNSLAQNGLLFKPVIHATVK